jgi:hypothetical protein
MRVAFEIPDDRFDRRLWGGIETALWHLGGALSDAGVEVNHVTAREAPDDDALHALTARAGFDAVFPLGERAAFRAPDAARHPELVARMIRIWHDVRPLSGTYATPPVCAVHSEARGAGDGARCVAAAVRPEAPVGNVFLSDAPWTRCFAQREVIPWSTSHVAGGALRDAAGPVLVLAGKIANPDAQRLIRGLADAGQRVRVIVSNWTGVVRRIEDLVPAPDARIELVLAYDVRRERERVFGGASCLIALSRFHETFDFLSAEASAVGLPVIALDGAGNTRRFAAALVASVDEAIALVEAGSHAALGPRPAPAETWVDVAARYLSLLERRGPRA